MDVQNTRYLRVVDILDDSYFGIIQQSMHSLFGQVTNSGYNPVSFAGTNFMPLMTASARNNPSYQPAVGMLNGPHSKQALDTALSRITPNVLREYMRSYIDQVLSDPTLSDDRNAAFSSMANSLDELDDATIQNALTEAKQNVTSNISANLKNKQRVIPLMSDVVNNDPKIQQLLAQQQLSSLYSQDVYGVRLDDNGHISLISSNNTDVTSQVLDNQVQNQQNSVQSNQTQIQQSNDNEVQNQLRQDKQQAVSQNSVQRTTRQRNDRTRSFNDNYQQGTVVSIPSSRYKVFLQRDWFKTDPNFPTLDPLKDVTALQDNPNHPPYRGHLSGQTAVANTDDSPITTNELLDALGPFLSSKKERSNLEAMLNSMSRSERIQYLDANGQVVNAKAINSYIDNKELDPNIQRSVRVLDDGNGHHLSQTSIRQMTSLLSVFTNAGIDYKFITTDNNPGQLDIRLNDNSGTKVRIMDLAEPYAVGTVTTRGFGHYSPNFSQVKLKRGRINTADDGVHTKADTLPVFHTVVPSMTNQQGYAFATSKSPAGSFDRIAPVYNAQGQQLSVNGAPMVLSDRNIFETQLNNIDGTRGLDKSLPKELKLQAVKASQESSLRTYTELPEDIKNYMAIMPSIIATGIDPESTPFAEEIKAIGGNKVTNKIDQSYRGGTSKGWSDIGNANNQNNDAPGMQWQRSVDRNMLEIARVNAYRKGSRTTNYPNGKSFKSAATWQNTPEQLRYLSNHVNVDLSQAIRYVGPRQATVGVENPYELQGQDADREVLQMVQNARQNYFNVITNNDIENAAAAFKGDQAKYDQQIQNVLADTTFGEKIELNSPEANTIVNTSSNILARLMDGERSNSIVTDDNGNMRIQDNYRQVVNDSLAEAKRSDPSIENYEERIKSLVSQQYDLINQTIGIGGLTDNARLEANNIHHDVTASDTDFDTTLDVGNVVALDQYQDSNANRAEFRLANALKQSPQFKDMAMSNNEFEKARMLERLVTYDPSSAVNISDLQEQLKAEKAEFTEEKHPEWFLDHQPIADVLPAQFKLDVMNAVRDKLSQNGVTLNKDDAGNDMLTIDKNGLIHYEGTRQRYKYSDNQTSTDEVQPISGTIGQVFTPDHLNLIHPTLYGQDADPLITNYRGIYKTPDRDKTYFDQYDKSKLDAEYANGSLATSRLRIFNWRQLNTQQALSALQSQLMTADYGDITRPEDTTKMNKMIHGLVAVTKVDPETLRTKHLADPETGEERTDKESEVVTEDMLKASIVDRHNKIRMSNRIGESTDTSSVRENLIQMRDYAVNWQKLHPDKSLNDLTFGDVARALNSATMFNGIDNAGIKAREMNRGVISYAGTSQGKAQGTVAFKDRLAKVDKNGDVSRNTAGPKTDKYPDGTPLAYGMAIEHLPIFNDLAKEPFDRGFVALEQFLKANYVDNDTKVAIMNLATMDMEDGNVISKHYAETHPVKGADGKMRPLEPGDKLSDGSGNKSTIAHVIDPNMSLQEAEQRGLTDVVLMFRDNNVDMIEAGSSQVSRNNTGLIQHMIDSHSTETMKIRLPKRDENGNLIPRRDENGNIIRDESRLLRTKMADNRKSDKELLSLEQKEIAENGHSEFERFVRDENGNYQHPIEYEMEDTPIDTNATIGSVPIFVTDQLVDKKTAFYANGDSVDASVDSETAAMISTRKGRKYGQLLVNADASRGAYGVVQELLSSDPDAVAKYREYCRVAGIDFGADGEFQPLRVAKTTKDKNGNVITNVTDNARAIHSGEDRKQFNISFTNTQDGQNALRDLQLPNVSLSPNQRRQLSASTISQLNQARAQLNTSSIINATNLANIQTQYIAYGDPSKKQLSSADSAFATNNVGGDDKGQRFYVGELRRGFNLTTNDGAYGLNAFLDRQIASRVNSKLPFNARGNDIDAGETFLKSIANSNGDLNVPEALAFTLPGFENNGVKTTKLSILPPDLRRNTQMLDDQTKLNDFSAYYSRIGLNVSRYQAATEMLHKMIPQRDLASFNGNQQMLDQYNQQRADIMKRSEKYFADKYSIQSAVSQLSNQIGESYLGMHNNVKHAYMRDNLMSKLVPHSISGVITNGAPDVKFDEVEVSPAAAKQMGYEWDPITGLAAVKGSFERDAEGQIRYDIDNETGEKQPRFRKGHKFDMVHVHRDPAWRGPNSLGLKLKVNPSITGIRISPITVSLMDGDFDGDQVGIMPITTPAGQKDLHNQLSVAQNMFAPGTNKDNPQLLLNIGAELIDTFYKTNYDHAAEGPGSEAWQQTKEQWNNTHKDEYSVNEIKNTKQYITMKATMIAEKRYKDADHFTKIGQIDKASKLRQEALTDIQHYFDNATLQPERLANSGINYVNENTAMDGYREYVKSGAKGKAGSIDKLKHYLHAETPNNAKYIDKGLAIRKQQDAASTSEEKEAVNEAANAWSKEYENALANWTKDMGATQAATKAKSDGTSTPGSYQQKVVAALRQFGVKGLNIANAQCYPYMQKNLGIKREPTLARQLTDLMSNDGLGAIYNAQYKNEPMLYGLIGADTQSQLGTDLFEAAKKNAMILTAAAGNDEKLNKYAGHVIKLDQNVNKGQWADADIKALNDCYGFKKGDKGYISKELADSACHGMLDKDGENSLDFLKSSKDPSVRTKYRFSSSKDVADALDMINQKGGVGLEYTVEKTVADYMFKDGSLKSLMAQNGNNKDKESLLDTATPLDRVNIKGFNEIKSQATRNAHLLAELLPAESIFTPNADHALTNKEKMTQLTDNLNQAKKEYLTASKRLADAREKTNIPPENIVSNKDLTEVYSSAMTYKELTSKKYNYENKSVTTLSADEQHALTDATNVLLAKTPNGQASVSDKFGKRFTFDPKGLNEDGTQLLDPTSDKLTKDQRDAALRNLNQVFTGKLEQSFNVGASLEKYGMLDLRMKQLNTMTAYKYAQHSHDSFAQNLSKEQSVARRSAERKIDFNQHAERDKAGDAAVDSVNNEAKFDTDNVIANSFAPKAISNYATQRQRQRRLQRQRQRRLAQDVQISYINQLPSDVKKACNINDIHVNTKTRTGVTKDICKARKGLLNLYKNQHDKYIQMINKAAQLQNISPDAADKKFKNEMKSMRDSILETHSDRYHMQNGLDSTANIVNSFGTALTKNGINIPQYHVEHEADAVPTAKKQFAKIQRAVNRVKKTDPVKYRQIFDDALGSELAKGKNAKFSSSADAEKYYYKQCREAEHGFSQSVNDPLIYHEHVKTNQQMSKETMLAAIRNNARTAFNTTVKSAGFTSVVSGTVQKMTKNLQEQILKAAQEAHMQKQQAEQNQNQTEMLQNKQFDKSPEQSGNNIELA